MAKISKYQLFSVSKVVTFVNFSPCVFKSRKVGRIIMRLVIPAEIDTTVKSMKDLILILKSHEV